MEGCFCFILLVVIVKIRL